MTFMSFMKKESTKKGHEKRIKAYGKGRYDGYDPENVDTDFDELKRLRNQGSSKRWKFFKVAFLIFAFVLIILMLLNLFMTIPRT